MNQKQPLQIRLDEFMRELVEAGLSHAQVMGECERRYVIAAYESAGKNQCKAARQSGLHRNTFRRKLPKESARPYKKPPMRAEVKHDQRRMG